MAPSLTLLLLLLLFLAVGSSSGRQLYPLPSKKPAGKPLQTFRPFNVAHRGANGEFPEESVPSYLRAIEEGADFIEGDILATKDGHLICFHDVILDDTTDISDHPEFADRKRTYNVQGIDITGFFTVDFTLDELKLLRLKQRYPFRDQQHNGKYQILTFDEFIAIALNAPRVVGIYPEIKNPTFINQQVKFPGGKSLEQKIIQTLKKYGYGGSYLSEEWLKKPCFIQSFAPSSLVYISQFTNLPKVLLIDDVTIPTQHTNQTFYEITSDEYLEYISNYCMAIGPWKDNLVETDLVARAHAHNLQVHPYTFRNENQFLKFNFSQDPYKEYDYWINTMGVDGLFTDFTGSLKRFQEWTNPCKKC